MEVSLIIVTRHRPALLRRCLDSISHPPPGVEVLLIVNGRGQGEEALAVEAAGRWPWLRIVQVERLARGAARNRAVEEARGRLLYFLDDDTLLPDGFLDRLLRALDRHPDAPCLGGPNVTPAGASPLQRAIDFLLRSPLGAGPMRIRYSLIGEERAVPGWSLMLCSLGVRREVFARHGIRFPDHCASAEENLLLSRIERRVGPPVYSPSLFVYHERRQTLCGFCRQVFLSGQGRMQITRMDPASLQPAALAPPAFVLYLACLPWAARPALAWPAWLYAAACLAETLRLALGGRDPAAALWLPLLFPLGHVSYACGMARGLADDRR